MKSAVMLSVIIGLVLAAMLALGLGFFRASSPISLTPVAVGSSGTTSTGAAPVRGWLRVDLRAQRSLDRQFYSQMDVVRQTFGVLGLDYNTTYSSSGACHFDVQLTEEHDFESLLPSVTGCAVELLDLRDGLDGSTVVAQHWSQDWSTLHDERRLRWDEQGVAWE